MAASSEAIIVKMEKKRSYMFFQMPETIIVGLAASEKCPKLLNCLE